MIGLNPHLHPANAVRSSLMAFPATVDADTLNEVIRRIVAVAEPERIILFGSAARGDMRRDSDFDLLVVKGGAYDYGRLLGAIYRSLIGIDYGVDVVLVTPDDAERYRDSPALIIASALHDGREVYRASALSSR